MRRMLAAVNPADLSDQVRNLITDVPDFPKPGIVFKDLTPVFGDGATGAAIATMFAERYAGQGIDAIVAIESRGFLLGAPMAARMEKPLVLVRKPGKLPRETLSQSYQLEYGEDTLQIHADALEKGQRVVIVDDLLATGGTAEATCNLVRQTGAEIAEVAFLVELGFLQGRARLSAYDCFSVVTY